MVDTYAEGRHKIFEMIYGPAPDPKELDRVLAERKLTKDEKIELYAIIAGGKKR